MKSPSDSDRPDAQDNTLRNKILGLGESSVRKSYYPALQKKMEELELNLDALRQSEENLRITLNSIGDAMIATDKAGNVTRINRIATLLTGLTADAAIGQKIADVMVISDAENGRKLPPIVDTVLAHCKTARHGNNLLLHSQDGHEYRISASGAPIMNLRNEVDGAVIIFRDITEEYQMQIKLHESENRYRSLVAFSPLPIILVKDDGLFTYFNNEAMQLFGFSHFEEIYDTHYSSLLSPDEWTRADMEFKECLAGAVIHDHRYMVKKKDGSIFPVLLHATATPDLTGHRRFVLIMPQDLSEREKMLETIRQNEENLRITINSIGDAVIATDCQGVITRINNVAVKLTGWSQEEAIGQPLNDVLQLVKSVGREHVENPVNRVLSSGSVVALESDTVLISRNGNEYEIADSAAPILNSQNQVVGVVMVFRDVTVEHKLEEQLFQAQKMDSIGQLAGGVAHDFNNMLTGIMAASDMLRRKLKDADPGIIKLIDIISGSCQRSADLTRKLLSFARKGKLLSIPHDVHRSIEAAVSLLERSIDRKVEINLQLNAINPIISCDPAQLDNIFINLGLNARDAMVDGGVILILTRNVYLSSDYNREAMLDIPPGNYLHISFSDTGCGIPPEILPRIFEPFFTTKEIGNGTGLGLSAVYGAVKEHQGALRVNSTPGHGTTFHLYFPSLTTVATTPQESRTEIRRNSGTVLLIDDEQFILDTGKAILSDVGYSVLLAGNGQEGLEVYRHNFDKIDIVILDMIMPKMSGKECLAEMKKINPMVKIVVSTGFTSEKALEEFDRNTVAGVLKKPFTINELCDVLHNVLSD